MTRVSDSAEEISMGELSRSKTLADRLAGPGCAYILDDGDGRRFCDGVPRRGSSYCQQHHAVCHVPSGTTEETRRLREVEELARRWRTPRGGGCRTISPVPQPARARAAVFFVRSVFLLCSR